MASVINTNIAATRTHNVYNRNNEFMNAAMTRVATGMKINSAKDGASTWAISEKMRERIRANDQANQNIQNDTALLKVAQGGVGNAIDILKTLKERAINSLNDSNMDADRDRIAVEVEQLLEQIDKNATTVKFNGRVLLDGTGATDTTGGNFTAGSSTSTGSVKAATPVNPPDGTTGSNALFKLAQDSSQDLVNDLGFKAGDTITFSWKEDGTEKTADAITVAAGDTLADLVAKFGTSGTFSKLTLENVAAGDDVGTVTDGTTQITNTGITAALYAYGTGETQITALAVSVLDADGNTNEAAQTAMKFTGVQQAAVTPTGNYAVYSTSALGTDSDGNALSTSTVLKRLSLDGSSNAFTTNKYLGLSWSEDGTTKSITPIPMDNSKAMSDLISAAGTAGLTIGIQSTAGGISGVTSDGVSVAAGALYFYGASGKSITDIKFNVYDDSAGATATTSDAANVASVNAALTQVQKYAAAEESGDNDNTGSGTTTALTFHIGGESSMSITANIGSMTVANLFKDSSGTAYDSGTFAGLFTKKSTAETALAAIDKALDTALNEQTKLGAMENRLGYASDNITTMNENLEAADSVMRDSDIAKEMTSYMKYAVLSQASQYMLAQAGQNAYQVLNLLQQ